MKKRPNILWLCADQQRYDTIHALGNDHIDTPYLDRLCREGVAFTNAYCQNPVCTPSRASFLTGKYPSAINANILGGANNPEHCTLITKALADSGYCCGNIGKLHISAAWEGFENRCDDGYSVFIYSLSPGHDLESGCNEYKTWLEEKGVDWHDLMVGDGKRNYYWYREDAPEELRQTAWCAEKAIEFIKEHDGETPWLLTVNCFDPHPPYDAPAHLVEKYLARNIPDPIFNDSDYALGEQLKTIYHQSKGVNAPNDQVRRERASYYGMCELVDAHFGRMIDALDEMGIREDTVIIFTSDHGEMLGDHGLTHKGCRFYEGAVHVPLLFSCPGRFASGKRVEGITELTDIAPTIAELCGIEFPDTHGNSLVKALSEDGGEGIEREYVRCEYYQSCRGGKNPTQSYATMLRDRRYKIVVYHGVEAGELYDMIEDPCEEHNLWDLPEYAELRFKLLKKSFDVAAVVQRPGQVRNGRY